MSPTMSRSTTEPDQDIPANNHHLDPQNPSLSSSVADPETPNASPSSTTFPPMQAFSSASSQDHNQDLDFVPDLPVSRNIRELAVTRQRSSLQQIRRKPLSSTASSVATRYSSGEYLTIAKSFPMPEHRFSRSYSLDSPTVYDFPSIVRTNTNLDSATKPQTIFANKG